MKILWNRFLEILRPLPRRYRTFATVWALNVPLMALVLAKNLGQVPPDLLSTFYAQTVVAYYALPILLVCSVLFVVLAPLRRTMFMVTGVTLGVFVYWLFLDSLVYAVTRIHIDFFWLEFLLRDFTGFGFPATTVVAAVAVLLAALFLQVGIYRLARKHPLRWPWLIGIQLLIVLSFGLSQVLHIVAYQRNDARITSLTPHYPLYIPFTSHGNAERYGDLFAVFGIGEAEAEEQGSQSLHYPRHALEFSEVENPPNLLVILLESWRYDVVTPEVMPQVSSLAERSWVFDNHLSSGNQTTCGLFGVFYGLHATYWSAVKANNALIDNPVLIDRLQDLGYDIGVYADSNFDRHKVKDTVFAGIEVHEDFAGSSVEEHDRDMANQVKDFISAQTAAQKPFMAFAFFKASHYSYYYPEEHRVFRPAKDLRLGFTGGDTEPEKYWNDYCNSVHYDDALVGEIVEHLEQLGQMDNTIVVLSTDHGEEFNDNHANFWGHGSNFTRYQVQVPLILHLPGREPRRIEQASSHVDLVPTLMAGYLGCKNDVSDYSSGRELDQLDDELRPFVVGSYFNHAFVLGQDVYDVGPTGTRVYNFDDIGQEGSSPDPRLIQRVMREINSFYEE